VPLYQRFDDMPLVSISDKQREPLPFANWVATVHHGLPPDLFTYSAEAGGYLAFLGRISPEKRPDRAIRIARRAGIPLKIAAKVDAADKAYFESVVKPLLDEGNGVEFIGEIGDREKSKFLGGAAALLCPIDWPEPFGLVIIESMACGTPVIAWPGGSVPEIIRNDVNGRIVTSEEEAVDALADIAAFDRARCRRDFEERFTSSAWRAITCASTAGSSPARASLRHRVCGLPHEARNPARRGHPHRGPLVCARDFRARGDPTRVLKHGESFALFDRYGDMPRAGSGEHGFYHQGTRFLSRYELRMNGHRPLLLNSSVRRDNRVLTVDGTNPDDFASGELTILKGTVHLSRSWLLWDDVCHERIELGNYGASPVTLHLTIELDNDYVDIFEVRGFRRERRGEDLVAKVGADRVELGYRGLDGVVRRTQVAWSIPPVSLAADRADFEIAIAPHATVELETTISCALEGRDLCRPDLLCRMPERRRHAPGRPPGAGARFQPQRPVQCMDAALGRGPHDARGRQSRKRLPVCRRALV
jgi:hypothetical protein